MSDPLKTVFISYRWEPAWVIARLVESDLRAHGYDVFLDVKSLGSGLFGEAILRQIDARAHFIVILTPGTVEECAELDDWMRREIERAMDTKRNIVPLFVYGFTFDGTEKYLTGKLTQLHKHYGLPLNHVYWEAGMATVRNRFLRQMVCGDIVPAPESDQALVHQQQAEAAAQPIPNSKRIKRRRIFLTWLC